MTDSAWGPAPEPWELDPDRKDVMGDVNMLKADHVLYPSVDEYLRGLVKNVDEPFDAVNTTVQAVRRYSRSLSRPTLRYVRGVYRVQKHRAIERAARLMRIRRMELEKAAR